MIKAEQVVVALKNDQETTNSRGARPRKGRRSESQSSSGSRTVQSPVEPAPGKPAHGREVIVLQGKSAKERKKCEARFEQNFASRVLTIEN